MIDMTLLIIVLGAVTLALAIDLAALAAWLRRHLSRKRPGTGGPGAICFGGQGMKANGKKEMPRRGGRGEAKQKCRRQVRHQ
jgi:hypothetical protein